MSKPIDQEREAFIATASTHRVEGIGFKLDTVSSGSFLDNETRMLWEGWKLARAAVQPAGVAVPEGVDPLSLQNAIQKVVARERMRPLSRTDSHVAESIYQAIIEQLPLYEDVYGQLTEMIEPHVDRLGRKGCFLPASVVDSVRLLLDAYLAAAPHPVSGDQKAVEHAPLYEAVERVAAELPEGWEVRICVERDAGTVELFDADRCQVDGFPTNYERLDFTVIDALEAALAAHRAQAQGGDV